MIPTPNPQPVGQGSLSLPGTSLRSCPPWTLPVTRHTQPTGARKLLVARLNQPLTRRRYDLWLTQSYSCVLFFSVYSVRKYLICVVSFRVCSGGQHCGTMFITHLWFVMWQARRWCATYSGSEIPCPACLLGQISAIPR